jgi:hypothetical protein
MFALLGKFKGLLVRLRYWTLATAVYAALVYSTGLHYAYAPESRISLDYFTSQPRKKTDFGAILQQEFYKDRAILADRIPIVVDTRDFWKLPGFYGDSAYYLLQAKSLGLSVPPYKYRFLPTSIAGVFADVSGWGMPKVFAFLNVIYTISTAVLFTVYLGKYFGFSKMLSFLGGILFITMAANTNTIPLPMLEPASFLCCILIFIAVVSRNSALFIISSACGVATKEILVISSLLWFINSWPPKRWSDLAKSTFISSTPIIAFVLIRWWLGSGHALELNFGYNVLQGQFPPHYKRVLGIAGFVQVCKLAFLSFSFLWLGLLNIRKNRFLKRSSVLVPLVLLAVVLLSDIQVKLGILFPIVIPSFLLFFSDEQSNASEWVDKFGCSGDSELQQAQQTNFLDPP